MIGFEDAAFEDVLITPHNAGHTPKCWEWLFDAVADNVAGLGESGGRRNRVV